MDAVVKPFAPKPTDKPAYMDKAVTDRPTQAEAEAAVRTLLRWAGDDPDREGLIDTPRRVAKAYGEMFGGYDQCAATELGTTFEEIAGYDDLVVVRDIQFHSHCEHHMGPIIGRAHVGYLPDGKVVGRGVVAYDDTELASILGRSTSDLPVELRRPVVHADDLVAATG